MHAQPRNGPHGWATANGANVLRMRGRKLQAERRRLHEEHPFCAHCGVVLQLVDMVRDHVIPIAEGGLDVDANIQPLCQACSDIKTQHESQRGKARATG